MTVMNHTVQARVLCQGTGHAQTRMCAPGRGHLCWGVQTLRGHALYPETPRWEGLPV